MPPVCPTEKCTGCSACVNICHMNAVSLKPDSTGFLYPEINGDICVGCNKCRNICPQNTATGYNSCGDFFAGVSFDDEVKEQSSSGGIFSLVAESIIKKGGVVFGAAYDDQLEVKHIAVEYVNDLHKLRGSKYAQSVIGDTYLQVKKLLFKNRFVLFSGTPCQIDGLYAFLGKDASHKKLYTVDVLCHGVPSPEILKEFIRNENSKYGEQIAALNFRSKSTGWLYYSTNLKYKNGSEKEIYRDDFMRGFLSNYYLRECCYDCRYSKTERIGDITLGDFWGYREKAPAFLEDDNRGISLVIVNNEHGYELIKSIRSKAALVKKNVDEAIAGNPVLHTPSKRPEDYEEFHKDYTNMSWDEISSKYFPVGDFVPPAITEENKSYFSQPFKKRYYKHLLACKFSEFKSKINGGK